MKTVAGTVSHMPTLIATTLKGQGMIIATLATKIDNVSVIVEAALEVVRHTVTAKRNGQRKVVTQHTIDNRARLVDKQMAL
jgi:hypothetical protein